MSKFYKKVIKVFFRKNNIMLRWYWKPMIALLYEETINIRPYFFLHRLGKLYSHISCLCTFKFLLSLY